MLRSMHVEIADREISRLAAPCLESYRPRRDREDVEPTVGLTINDQIGPTVIIEIALCRNVVTDITPVFSHDSGAGRPARLKAPLIDAAFRASHGAVGLPIAVIIARHHERVGRSD